MSGFASLFRTVVSLGWLVALGGGGWLAYQLYFSKDLALEEKEKELAQKNEAIRVHERTIETQLVAIDGLEENVETLEEEVEVQGEQIEKLDLNLKLLKVSRRMAQVAVLDKQGDESSGDLRTKVKFVEVDEEGRALGPSQVVEIDGDVLYVDAWVVKFDDALVEEGADPDRASSICVFRRMFGEDQTPNDGIVLDEPSKRPNIYGGDEPMGELERQVWDHFWEYANDPEKAAELGIRAMHGEAPSMKMERGKVYKLTLRASGGLSFEPVPLPAVIDD